MSSIINQRMDKHKFENIVTEFTSNIRIGYDKCRVSGSINMPYYMHCRSAYMPGQKNNFTISSITNKDVYINNRQSRISDAYKRERFQLKKKKLGPLSYNNRLSVFTFQQYIPFDDQSLEISIIASYKHVFGNLIPMYEERSIDLERRLRNGDIPIREFIRGIAKSKFYIKNYFENISQEKSIKLSIMHILGRTIKDNAELIKYVELIHLKGFEHFIDLLIDSIEYEEIFGENIVPYIRTWNSPCGSKTVDFIKTATYAKGYASSDNV